MTDTDEGPQIPSPGKKGWKIIFGGIGLLALTALILSLIYRQQPRPTELLERKKRAAATHVVYTVVFSKVDDATTRRALDRIVRDVTPDSAVTDLVIGSTVTDPWCASVNEYQRMILKACRETGDMRISKQTQVMSMIAGLLTKSTKPATIYLLGSLTDAEPADYVKRTEQTAAGIALRNEVIGPVRVVSFLDTTKTINARYLSILRDKGFGVEQDSTISR